MELAKEYDLHHKIKLKLNHFIEKKQNTAYYILWT